MNKGIISKLNPPATIGIVGGGQLGRMLVLEAKRMGYHVVVLDPKPNSPAGQVADEQIVGDYSDLKALEELAQKTEVLTYEFEHIDVASLALIEKGGYKIYPSSKTLGMIQNKYVQKSMLKSIGISVPEFRKINSLDELTDVFYRFGQRLVLKTCREGYDGKGNGVITESGQIEDFFQKFSNLEMMVEKFIDFSMEVSIVVAKNHDGIVLYPVAENIHKDSILVNSMVPAKITKEIQNKIFDISKKIVEELNDYGVFCIEFFIDSESNVLVNEIAPRPHNSCHYSIEGCVTSQFEQLIRVITGMPLGSSRLRSPSVMYNILGCEGDEGEYSVKGVDLILNLEDCHFHLYGKAESEHLKKIGHITSLDDSVESANRKAIKALSMLKVESHKEIEMMNNKVQDFSEKPVVGIIMGSESDLPVMEMAAFVLEHYEIPYEIKVVSAHRTPERMYDYAKSAQEREIEVIIAGAGGSAHLPGMVASMTTLPVIGVPVKLKALEGLDSLLSIVQMPGGVPVATVGINNAKNAGILAARILGIKYPSISEKINANTEEIKESVIYNLEERLKESRDFHGTKI